MTSIDNVLNGGTVSARLRRFLTTGDGVRPVELFAGWRSADIANVLGGFPAEDAARILMVFPPRQRASIVVYFDPRTRAAIAAHFPPRLREDLVIRTDRLVRRNGHAMACRAGEKATALATDDDGHIGDRDDSRGLTDWAAGMALDAATGVLRRGHRLGVIGPKGLARGLIKVAGWRGRLRRQSQNRRWRVAA